MAFPAWLQRFRLWPPEGAGYWHKTSKAFPPVIRITTQRAQGHAVVTIDGRLAESDLGELRRVRKSVTGAVCLNLRGLESCADSGILLLRAWLGAEAKLQDANPFLRMILEDSPS